MRLVLNEHDRLIELHPDPDHPMSHGYVCFKGLQAVDLYQNPDRIIHTLKRNADGNPVRIGVEEALDEIAAKLQGILASHPADAVGIYRGSGSFTMAIAYQMHGDWLRAIGSRSDISSSWPWALCTR